MVTADAIQYPALIYSKGHVFPYKNGKLGVCSAKALKDGFYGDLFVIDCVLNKFQIEGIKVLGGVLPFWGYRLLFYRQLKVELYFKDPFLVSIEQARAETIQAVLRGRDFWEAAWNTEKLNKRISLAQSVAKIVNCLDPT